MPQQPRDLHRVDVDLHVKDKVVVDGDLWFTMTKIRRRRRILRLWDVPLRLVNLWSDRLSLLFLLLLGDLAVLREVL